MAMLGVATLGVGALGGMAPAAAGPHLVVDLASGKVLEQQDAFRRWYPASLTKLMTTYVVFRAIRAGEITMNSPVRVSQNAAKEPPSKMGFKPGSVLTVDNAVKILMVKSANDVATAVAESVGGSVPAFAARMNAEARRIGMNGSRWVNAHGLHNDGQYTTAHDLALLASAIRKEFPQYLSYFSIEAIQSGKALIENHNNLIARFPGADGMKTGYTCPSGFNLVASATRGGRTLLAVVIGETSVEDRDEKAAELLGEAFEKGGFGAPRLASMNPSGAMQNQATNMREAICTDAARKERLAKRAEDGRRVLRSSHLRELDRPRRVIQVALGGATGPSTQQAATSDILDIPVPTPRPDYTPRVAEGG
ncbi:MAG: D-alanyl-D-alanine carboxypeptidase [Rhizobiaceae bacterium]|nr:D-alanyl-D-alanine carboxypeptidase [Rhizobiaceae bacterium]